MDLKRITHKEHPMYPKALKLYRLSFPYYKQRETFFQEKILSDKEYHFCLLYDEEVFVGLVLYWETESFLYIEHFCILPEMRNKQYEQRAFALLNEQGKTLILEIDPQMDRITRRGKGFYERCGFAENTFSHIHPSYRRGYDGYRQVVITCPTQISQDMFDTFNHYLKKKVMGDVFT